MSRFKKYLGKVTKGKNSNPIKHYTEKNIEDNEPAFLNLINELDDDDINKLRYDVTSIHELKLIKSKNLQNIVTYFSSGREKMDHMSADFNFQELKEYILENYKKIKDHFKKLKQQ
jgi:hypothetical protein